MQNITITLKSFFCPLEASFPKCMVQITKNLLSAIINSTSSRISHEWLLTVGSLSWEDPLEEEMANHSSILAWKIPWTGEHVGLQSIGLQTVRHN